MPAVKGTRHVVVAASGWGSWLISVAVQVAMIRVVVQTLGAERYAAFAVLYALNGWFVLADLGLGFSLQNSISSSIARARGYGGIARRVITVAVFLLLLEFAILVILSSWGGNYLLRRFTFLAGSDKWVLFLTACTLMLIAGMGQVVYKMWFGEHRGYLSNILPAGSLLVGLGAARVTILYSRSLQSVVLAYLLPPALVGLFCLLRVWLRTRSEAEIPRGQMQPLLRKAASFGGFAIMAALVLQVDLPMVAQFLPPKQIAAYAVISRIFACLAMIFSSVLQALWPVCTAYLALGNWAPVKRYIRFCILGGFALTAVCTLLIALKINPIIAVIAPGAMLQIPLAVILLFGGLYLLRAWTDTFAMVLQSRSQLLPFWISTPIQAALSVALQILLIPRLGLPGAVLGMAGSFLLTASWILPYFLLRSMRHEQTLTLESVA